MSKYFRFIGTIEMAGFIIGVIYSLIDMVGAFNNHSPDSLLKLFIFIAVLVFGPALGLLFFSVADLLDTEAKRETDPYKAALNEKNSIEEPDKRLLIAKNNYDRHLSEIEVEELMKLSLDDLKKLFEQEKTK